MIISLILSLQLASSYLIASSSIESCLNSGSNDMNCTNKLVVSLSVNNDQGADTESLETIINTTSTSEGSKQLVYPIKITLSKTKVTARYPLRYRQDFNSRARELVIFTSIFDCQDGAYSNSPTCGWKTDSKGDRIWDSQGYCCDCDFSQIIGLDDTTYTRGQSCQLFNLGTGSSSAHCLVWDELWYSAYEISTYQTYYLLTAYISKAYENGTYYQEKIVVSPSVPVQSSAEKDIIVRLIGDFSPNTPPPTLSDQYLFSASRPVSNTRVLMGSRYWMFIDGDDISWDGTQCNKVGSSYTAFRGQGNKCEMQPRSCFLNQLEDRHQTDIKRTANGQAPLYFISKEGNFSKVISNSDAYLQLNIDGNFGSLVTIELNGDKLKFITNVSKGKIDYAHIGNFEALSYDGVLDAQVSNVGNVAAQFTLGANCSSGVAAIEAKTFSLKAMESKDLEFDVNVQKSNASQYECNATLYNSIGIVVDYLVVNFNTSSRHTDTGSEGGNGPKLNGDNTTDSNPNDSCSESCPQWFNIFCFLVDGCWGDIIIFFSIIFGICLFVILTKFVIRRYGICCQKLFATKEDNKK
ncbi:unnamed protein product [Blepharisma stoltei]|uniref:Generative cell specific-1/HAP2 domain-containing protein n=1 Tax=Blepharisma stoltei TaxID=1481888 RepID=A0AAU9IRT3_9CILI|nr:unnamed protein product [Blepharisma stoltei]